MISGLFLSAGSWRAQIGWYKAADHFPVAGHKPAGYGIQICMCVFTSRRSLTGGLAAQYIETDGDIDLGLATGPVPQCRARCNCTCWGELTQGVRCRVPRIEQAVLGVRNGRS